MLFHFLILYLFLTDATGVEGWFCSSYMCFTDAAAAAADTLCSNIDLRCK
jgi:hypothetical protein